MNGKQIRNAEEDKNDERRKDEDGSAGRPLRHGDLWSRWRFDPTVGDSRPI